MLKQPAVWQSPPEKEGKVKILLLHPNAAVRRVLQRAFPRPMFQFMMVDTRTAFYCELDSGRPYDAMIIANDLGGGAHGVDVLEVVRTDEQYIARRSNTRAAVISGDPDAIRSLVEAFGDTVVFSTAMTSELPKFFATL